MERIDAVRAREQLDMVERILAEAQPKLCAGGEYFVIWGIGSAYVTLLFTLAGRGLVHGAALWSTPIVLALCVLFSILRGRSMQRALRASLVQREFFNVLWLTIGLAFVVNIGAYRIFGGYAAAAIWSVAESIVLLYIGMHGNRRAVVAGVLVVVSLVIANFASAGLTGYILAAGMLVGYAGFGASELLARE